MVQGGPAQLVQSSTQMFIMYQSSVSLTGRTAPLCYWVSCHSIFWYWILYYPARGCHGASLYRAGGSCFPHTPGPLFLPNTESPLMPRTLHTQAVVRKPQRRPMAEPVHEVRQLRVGGDLCYLSEVLRGESFFFPLNLVSLTPLIANLAIIVFCQLHCLAC